MERKTKKMKKLILATLLLFVQGRAIAVEIPRTLITPAMIEEQKSKCQDYIDYAKPVMVQVRGRISEEGAIRGVLAALFELWFWETNNDQHRLFLAEHILFLQSTNDKPDDYPYVKELTTYGKALIQYCDSVSNIELKLNQRL